MTILRALCIAGTVALTVISGIASAMPAPHTRHFEIAYNATIPVPAGAKSLRIWLPYPQSDAWQTISHIMIEAPYPHKVFHDAQYGNSILFLEARDPKAGSVKVSMRFDVLRREEINRPRGPHAAASAVDRETPQELARFLRPDRLVPITGKIAAVAREATRGKQNEPEKARAIYEYVTTHMRYDKSGTGWGRGDAIWACDTHRGNCTDFHSLLIGMARAEKIPAKFEIGLPLPEGRSSGAIPGYHCWAALYLPRTGWVPMDSSEASQHPAKRNYFFGAVDVNRVRLSRGRDLILVPRQEGAPINYFVYPYVEVNGKPLKDVRHAFSFRNLPDAAH